MGNSHIFLVNGNRLRKMFESRRQRGNRKNGPSYRGSRLNGDRTRAVFYKLLKDENAVMRSKVDALKFIEGMVSIESKAELLLLLDDERYCGPTRLKEALMFMDVSNDVDKMLIPILRCLVNRETNRPLYKRPRNRMISTINSIPGIYSILNEPDVLDSLTLQSPEVLVTYLETAVLTIAEARSSFEIKSLVRGLMKNNIGGTEKLSALLLLENKMPIKVTSTSNAKYDDGSVAVACWVSDQQEPGGRHDNDFTNFRDIHLVPTHDEILCPTAPWLPLASQENAFIENKDIRMLDANFRLLREDAVCSMKNNIEERKRVWQNARIIAFNLGFDNGRYKAEPLSFLVQLDSKYAKAAINWERSRALPHDGVVALIDPNDTKMFRLGTITIRKFQEKGAWLCNKQGPVIGISFHRPEDIQTSIDEAIQNMEILAKTNLNDVSFQELDVDERMWDNVEGSFVSFDLVEVSGSFFSYKPILSALQNMSSIPLARELVFLDASGGRPSYIPPRVKINNTYFDLDDWSNDKVIESMSLDKSQVEALHHTLMSRVALIQGPPGTGKTFIGSLITKILRDNTNESIMCICYTNHALDQFLENLHDQGERNIVRVGGRCKSDKIKCYNLKDLSIQKTEMSSEARKRMKSVIEKLKECHEEITNLTNQLSEPILWKKPRGGISSVLEIEDPVVYNHIMSLDSLVDGFEIVGKNNKRIDSEALFQQWTKGARCPEYVLPYVEVEDTDVTAQILAFWSIDKNERTNLAQGWRKSLFDDTYQALHEEFAAFEALCSERDSINRDRDLQILRDARVIGATTCGAAKYRDILFENSPGVVIVEEAGEVLEPHIITALCEATAYTEGTKHLILIGDHLQLRPKVESYKLSAASGFGYNFDYSMFERLIKSGFPSAMLQVQHRMRPYISNFIRSQTYPSLIDHPSTHEFQDVKGVDKNVLFLDHDNPEQGCDADSLETKTKANAYEAHMCIEIVRYLLLQGYKHEQIAVLTPYVGQVLKIIEVLKASMQEVNAYVSELDQEVIQTALSEGADASFVSEPHKPKSIRCSSIDNFQGEESDIVVMSLVRSNKSGIIGFLKEAQRVNVLLSRAKIGLYMVGNRTTLCQSSKGGHIWEPIFNRLERDGCLLKGFPVVCQLHPKDGPICIQSPDQFKECCPNGGCTRPCNSRLICGHSCPMACHPTDKEHLNAHKFCVNQCRRIPPECPFNHPCTKLCNEKCGKCETTVQSIKLLCGHVLDNPKCHEVRNDEAIAECSRRCSAKVSHYFEGCGHTCTTTCRNAQNEHPVCPGLCKVEMGCGHLCVNKCSSCKDHACNNKCKRLLLCGHTCNQRCHGETPCPPCSDECENVCVHSKCMKKCSKQCTSCTHDCEWQCEHQGRCPLVCGAPCSRLPCNKRCNKFFSCGHQCPSVCGEICPPIDYCQICCSTEKSNHIVDMIELIPYKDYNIDRAPVLVLPCGHFYSMTTLDGIFDMTQAYTMSDEEYTEVKTMTRNDNIKPKCCPDCRSVVHSVARYGRLLSFLRLQFLERKHLMGIGRSLSACAQKLIKSTAKDKQNLINIEKNLLKILKAMKNGPTQKVFEACGGNEQVHVPVPPSKSVIRALQLLGQTYAGLINSVADEYYQKALNSFKEAIAICDDTSSYHLGAETRLSLVRLQLAWIGPEDQLVNILDEIIMRPALQSFPELSKQAVKLKEQITAGNNMKLIVDAMHVNDGYDYIGSWSDHWYECPNGHPYFIGNCGQAMQTAKCVECGEEVGGSGHTLLSTNKQSIHIRRILEQS